MKFINLKFNLIINLTIVGKGRIICLIYIGILKRITVFVQGNKTLKISKILDTVHNFGPGKEMLSLFCSWILVF